MVRKLQNCCEKIVYNSGKIWAKCPQLFDSYDILEKNGPGVRAGPYAF